MANGHDTYNGNTQLQYAAAAAAVRAYLHCHTLSALSDCLIILIVSSCGSCLAMIKTPLVSMPLITPLDIVGNPTHFARPSSTCMMPAIKPYRGIREITMAVRDCLATRAARSAGLLTLNAELLRECKSPHHPPHRQSVRWIYVHWPVQYLNTMEGH